MTALIFTAMCGWLLVTLSLAYYLEIPQAPRRSIHLLFEPYPGNTKGASNGLGLTQASSTDLLCF